MALSAFIKVIYTVSFHSKCYSCIDDHIFFFTYCHQLAKQKWIYLNAVQEGRWYEKMARLFPVFVYIRFGK